MITHAKKKYAVFSIIISFVVMVVIIELIHVVFFNTIKPDLTTIDYRTDVEPLTKRFGETLNIESCFWKAGTIGTTNLGPSSYWMKGYVFVSKENADFLKSKYKFTNINIRWERGMTPNITQKNNFRWSYNKELSKRIIGEDFIGDFYFDLENNIFYFNLEAL